MAYLFASDSNGLEVSWNYQSASGNQQSVSWAYSVDSGAYSSPLSGTNFVSGDEWLSKLSYSGNWHEIHVALLDQSSGAELAYASHVFNYQSGSGMYQSDDGGHQSPTGGTGGGTGETPVNSIAINHPSNNAVIERNATLSVSISYQSTNIESVKWKYKLNEDFDSYESDPVVVTDLNKTDWLDRLDDGNHTVYVALFDPNGGITPLAEANASFELVGDTRLPFFYLTNT